MATFSISATARKAQTAGNGSAGPFSFSFQINAQSELDVFVDTTLKTLSTHYTVSVASNGTGTISFTTGNFPSSSQVITILGDTPLSRTSVYTSGGNITAAALESDFDTNVMVQQQQQEVLARTVKAPVDDASSVDMTLPNKDARKGKVLGFNATSGNVEAGPTITAVQSLSDVTASINLLGTAAVIEDMGLLSASAVIVDMGLLGTSGNVAAMAKLGVDAVIADMAILGTDAIVADMAILGTNDVVADMAILGTSDVVTDMNLLATAAVVEDMGLLATSAVIEDMGLLATSAVIEDMGLLATSAVIEDMGLLATSAVIEDMGLLASSATVADLALLGTSAVVADLAILATNDVVSDMNTLATSDIVNDMNVLGTSGNVTAMNLLGTSAVVEDMGLLSASAVIEDMGLLSAAAVIQDMGLLATSAVIEDMGLLATSAVIEDMGLLATSAVIEDMGLLGTSANVTSMSNVSGSINNVNTVASNLSGVNAFGARYRVQSGVPSSDNDVGDLVFDTNASTLKVFGASGFQNAGSSVNGTSARFHYDISSAVTSVTGSDASSNTLAYDAGFVDVFVNGVRQSTADVTVTSGDTVTFASALASGDEVDIVAYGTFAVANIVATGALNTGTITAGFGNINNGASTITTTGVGSFGSLDISGAIDVDGVTNLDVVDIDGAVNMATTALVTGVLTANGGAVFNEGSADVDFRVKSNDNANMLFVNAGTNQVGIGGVPVGVAPLHVEANFTTNVTNAATMIAATTFSVNGNTSEGSDILRIGPVTSGGAYFIEVSNGGGSAVYPLLLNPINGGRIGINTLAPENTFHVSGQTNGDYAAKIEHAGAAPYGLEIDFSAASPNSASREFIYMQDATQSKCIIHSTGDITNRNGTYGQISDVKLKENIVDANSQWDDLKAIRVRNFSFKAAELDAPNMIGLIAQEVEAAGMNGLVGETPDRDEDMEETGTVTKNVKSSILYMKAIKALQEAMTRIETLEAKVAVLEG